VIQREFTRREDFAAIYTLMAVPEEDSIPEAVLHDPLYPPPPDELHPPHTRGYTPAVIKFAI
jgi:hypothetical protein